MGDETLPDHCPPMDSDMTSDIHAIAVQKPYVKYIYWTPTVSPAFMVLWVVTIPDMSSLITVS